MTKKKNLIISGIIGGIFVAIDYIGTYAWCDLILKNGHEGQCPFALSAIEVVFFPIIPFFIFSLITYKMQDRIFQAWWKFSRIWIPLSMIAILVSPSYGNWMIPIEKVTVAFFSSAIFYIVSLVIIIRQSFRK